MKVYLVDNDNHDTMVFLNWDSAFVAFENDLRMSWFEFLEQNEAIYNLWVDGSVEERRISVDDGPSIKEVEVGC